MRFRLVLALSVVAFIFALPAQSKVITVTCTLTVNPKSGQPPLMVNANGSCTENGIPPAVFSTATVTVTNAPPSCTLSVVPTRGQAPLSVTATVNCTDPENDISSIVIDWGDGTSDQLCGDGCPTPPITATHTYNTPGTFFVSVTATDAFGAQGTSPTVTVTVLGPPPTVTSVKPPQGTQGTNLTVQGSGTNFVVTRGGKTKFA